MDRLALQLTKPMQLVPVYHRWERNLYIDHDKLRQLEPLVLILPDDFIQN